MKKTLAVAILVLAYVPSALAAHPAVPAGEKAQVSSILAMLNASDLAFFPGYVPVNYTIARTAQNTGEVTLTFTNKNYPIDSAQGVRSALNFAAQPFKGKLATCGKGSTSSEVVAGKTIFLKRGGTAWRCVRAPSGKLVVVFTGSSAVTFGEMAHVLASVSHS